MDRDTERFPPEQLEEEYPEDFEDEHPDDDEADFDQPSLF